MITSVAPKYRIEPRNGQCLIKVEDEEQRGHIIVVSTGDKPATRGRIVALPPDYRELDDATIIQADVSIDSPHEDESYNVGDIVVFGAFAGTQLKVDRQKFILLPIKHILALLVPDDNKGTEADSFAIDRSEDV